MPNHFSFILLIRKFGKILVLIVKIPAILIQKVLCNLHDPSQESINKLKDAIYKNILYIFFLPLFLAIPIYHEVRENIETKKEILSYRNEIETRTSQLKCCLTSCPNEELIEAKKALEGSQDGGGYNSISSLKEYTFFECLTQYINLVSKKLDPHISLIIFECEKQLDKNLQLRNSAYYYNSPDYRKSEEDMYVACKKIFEIKI